MSWPVRTEERERPAGARDRPALEQTMASAFFDDPVSTWAAPDERARHATLRRFFGALLGIHLGEGYVSTTTGNAGAAIWAAPGAWKTTPAQDLRIARAFAHPRHWPRAPLVGSELLRVERQHPDAPPHFYLAALGVHPLAQGRGLGAALMAPVLRACDEDGVGAYLESSKEANIAFYARHGFRVTREIRLRRGPSMWAMWRDPFGTAS